MNTTLPKEIWRTIFSLLSCNDLKSVIFVGSAWNNIANANTVWKEAVFNDSFPHSYPNSQTDVDWHQIAKRHFVTKRNIINKRCAQFSLGTSAALNAQTNLILGETTVSGKYCLIIWRTAAKRAQSSQTNQLYSAELWDTETRTIVQRYQNKAKLQLFNDYIVQENDNNQFMRYAKLDLTTEQVVFSGSIRRPGNFVTILYNEDPNSSLIAFNWIDWETAQSFVRVFDLRTGTQILQKDYGEQNPLVLAQFCGNKLVACVQNAMEGSLVVTEILFENGVARAQDILTTSDTGPCGTLAGDNLWMPSLGQKCFVKINTKTMERQTYEFKEDLKSAAKMRIYDGLLWVHMHSTEVLVYDLSSTTSQLLGQIKANYSTKLAQMPNGAFTCPSTDFAHILSFRGEDIELPIQVLQIEQSGQNKAIDKPQGDLNALVGKHIPNTSYQVSSQIVFEDDIQRYCVIFYFFNDSHLTEPLRPVNDCAERAKSWPKSTEPHKAALFALVDFKDQFIVQPVFPLFEDVILTARGACWVFFETKVDGGWLRSSPPDQWHFFKSKLGLN